MCAPTAPCLSRPNAILLLFIASIAETIRCAVSAATGFERHPKRDDGPPTAAPGAPRRRGRPLPRRCHAPDVSDAGRRGGFAAPAMAFGWMGQQLRHTTFHERHGDRLAGRLGGA